MKLGKLLAAALLTVAVAFSASARDEYLRDSSSLPKAAQSTLSKNFKAKVSLIKVDKSFGRIDKYDVVLTDGTEISFDRQGNWKEVETSAQKSVPSAFVPAAAQRYVKEQHKGQHIVGIERTRGGYDVELSNGIDIKFNDAGSFVKYDD